MFFSPTEGKYTFFQAPACGPNTSNLLTTTTLNAKTSKVENQNPNNSKCITTQQFSKLTTKIFETRLKQADLINKADFDRKLISFNRKIVSNKTKYLEILNSLVTKYHNFL